jgi:hypothetical protein
MRSGSSLVLLGVLIVSATRAGAQDRPAAKLVTIEGVVLDDEHEPVPSAEVGLTLQGMKQMLVRSDKVGHFAFDGVPAIPGKLMVRRLGYRVKTITLDTYKLAAGEPMQIALESVASDLDTVTVEAMRGRMEEFYNHKNNSSFGYFIDQPEIKKRAPRFVSELFRTIPGARIQVSRRIGNTITLRGCQPRIWVDGVRTQDTEVDEVANVDEVAAIEVYPSWAGTPPQYMDRETRACGTIVIWSRRQ